MGKKQFVINLVSNFLSVFVSAGIGFVLTPYIIRTLGVDTYGFFPLSNNLISYASLITVALNSMGTRFIMINIEKGKREVAKKYFNTLFYSNIILALLLGFLAFGFTVFIDFFLDVPLKSIADVKLLFYFIALNFIVTLSTSIFAVAPMTANRLDIEAFRNIVLMLVRASALLFLFYLFAPKLYFLGLSSLVVTILLGLINWRLLKRFLPDFKISSKFFNFKYLKELFVSGIWNSINHLSVLLLTQIDLILANVFLSAILMGQLSITKVIPSFIQTIVGVVVGVFIPKFYILYAKESKERLLKELFFSIKIVSMLAIIPISYFVVYGIDFFRIYTPNENIELINNLSVLSILPMIVTGSINTLFNIYTVTNKIKTPAIVWVGFGILNTLFVLFFIKYTELGIYSIPLVGLVTGLVRNLFFTPIYGAYCLGLKWNVFYHRIFKGMLCGLIMIAICYLFKYQFNFIPNSWGEFIVIAIITGSLALVGSVLINFEKKDIYSFLLLIKGYVKRN